MTNVLTLGQAALTVFAVQKFLLGTDMTLFTSADAPKQPYPSNDAIHQTAVDKSPVLIETVETRPPGYQIPPAF